MLTMETNGTNSTPPGKLTIHKGFLTARTYNERPALYNSQLLERIMLRASFTRLVALGQYAAR